MITLSIIHPIVPIFKNLELRSSFSSPWQN